ncbi:MAG: DUF5995 family protein [Prolixibacteraceae bacterium]
MSGKELQTIDDVITELKHIIVETELNGEPNGYFAVVYYKTTLKVKEKIGNDYFDDDQRMEKLDVVFAKRYIDAYYWWKANKRVSQSWESAFSFSQKKWPVVFQHLLMGMNAHINLDLGVAAAEISTRSTIYELRDDFYRINEILSNMVDEVQNNLSVIWPPLKKILLKTGKLDNFMVDFSMQIAREGAWEYAQFLAPFSVEDRPAEIAGRDERVVLKTKLITEPKWYIRLMFFIIRLGETDSVAEKIRKLKASVG